MKRIKLHKELRYSIIGILFFLIIISGYSAFSAIQESNTIEQMIPIYSYIHTGKYDYQVYLKPNSLYNTTILYPGQKTYFKKNNRIHQHVIYL